MNKTLELNFLNEEGNNSRISVNDPDENLSAIDVENVMEEIIQKNIFQSPGGDLVEINNARIISREVTELL